MIPVARRKAPKGFHAKVFRPGMAWLKKNGIPVVRRGGTPETATEELAVRLREAWCARHAKAGTGATIAGAVAAVKWWSFLNRPDQLRRVIADATSKDTQ